MAYDWPDAAWADIQYHEGDLLVIKSFQPDRTADFVRTNRRKHDQTDTLHLIEIAPLLRWHGYFNVVLKLTARLDHVSYIDIPDHERIYKWDNRYKLAGKTFIASTYLNNCNYFSTRP